LIGFVSIHVHEPVTLLIAIEPAQHIRKRPYAVADERNAIADGLPTLLDVGPQVRDSILVVHRVAGLEDIELTQPVFRDQYWQSITAGEASEPYA
jgi:hypothetical protein